MSWTQWLSDISPGALLMVLLMIIIALPMLALVFVLALDDLRRMLEARRSAERKAMLDRKARTAVSGILPDNASPAKKAAAARTEKLIRFVLSRPDIGVGFKDVLRELEEISEAFEANDESLKLLAKGVFDALVEEGYFAYAQKFATRFNL